MQKVNCGLFILTCNFRRFWIVSDLATLKIRTRAFVGDLWFLTSSLEPVLHGQWLSCSWRQAGGLDCGDVTCVQGLLSCSLGTAFVKIGKGVLLTILWILPHILYKCKKGLLKSFLDVGLQFILACQFFHHPYP